FMVSESAGAEAGPHVPPIGSVEVAPGVADEARPGGPAAAPQHLPGAKPGLGVLLVRIDDEARVGKKGTAGPLPDVADHLPAAPGTVTRRERADIDAASGGPIQVGVGRRWGLIAPGIPALVLLNSANIGRR